jgi:hypothetical protein
VADGIRALREMGPRWRAILGAMDGATVQRRPKAAVWSALEYAAHTRDVLAANGYLLHRTLENHRASIPTTSADEAADARDYNRLAPAHVLDELEANANRVATRAERASQDEWPRPIRVEDEEVRASLVDHGITDALAVLRHAVHEGAHHLEDVERNLAEILNEARSQQH